MKRLLAMLLLFAMVLGLLPAGIAAEQSAEPHRTVLTEEDYVLADLMWEEVNELEEQMLAKRAATSKTIEALINTVTASPYYAEGSLIRNGDHFFWKTVDGIACGYSPRMSAVAREADISTEEQTPSTLTYSYGTKAPSASARDVYLIQPYFGIDRDFTTQYVTEAENIAKALGGTVTIYRTTDATIDNIADAMEQGAVVIFDSHGDTDYSNGDDCCTRANTSYLLLQDGTGITAEDMEEVAGPFNTYYHAFYGGSYGEMKYYYVDGTAIANHMDDSAPNSLLWAALCLGMATDGIHKPLMEEGVAVTYGYSQPVTFEYDYDWEEIFWEEMISGKTVAEAVALMKSEVGCWDWCHHYMYDTIEEARKYFSAFPIVVSAEDPYPGHGKVDDLQTVCSTWTLYFSCDHAALRFCPEKPATCDEAGNIAYYYCEECTLCFADAEMITPLTWEEILIPAAHSYEEEVVPPTCEANGYTIYTCTVCGYSYNDDVVLSDGHNYETAVVLPTCTESGYTTYTCACGNQYVADYIEALGHEFTVWTPVSGEEMEIRTCIRCGHEEQRTVEKQENPFTDVPEGSFYHAPVLWAVANGITNGTSATAFGPDDQCMRAHVVTFLWRAAGSPEPESSHNPFIDVKETDFYYKAVLWAVEKGITNGQDETHFAPLTYCNRAQVATFLWRAKGQPASTGTDMPFTDVTAGAWYEAPVLWAVENGITNGMNATSFGINAICNRAQIVTFLYRAYN